MLTETIRRPGFEPTVSPCRRVNVPLQSLEDEQLFCAMGLVCDRRDCPDCGKARQDNTIRWFREIVWQFEEIYAAKLTESQYQRAKEQIQRRGKKFDAVYLAVPLQSGLIQVFSNVEFTGAEEASTEDAIEGIEAGILGMPAGKKQRCSRAIAFSRLKMEKTQKWRVLNVPLTADFGVIQAALKARGIESHLVERDEYGLTQVRFRCPLQQFYDVLVEVQPGFVPPGEGGAIVIGGRRFGPRQDEPTGIYVMAAANPQANAT